MNSRHFAWMVREKLAHKWIRVKSKVILATVSSTSEWLANEMFVFLNIVPNATVQYSSLWSSLFSKQLFLDACCHFDCKRVPLWPQFLCFSAVCSVIFVTISCWSTWSSVTACFLSFPRPSSHPKSVLVISMFLFKRPSVLWRCWLGGRKGIRPVKTEWWVLAWLSVWSEVQTCIWPSWCQCHSLSLPSVKSRLVYLSGRPYRFTRVVPEKRPLNGCVCVV